MRSSILLLMALVASTGCTNGQLRFSTARQVATLSELQHRIVLTNLAAFSCNPDAIPFQASLMNGTTQVVDTGSANYITQPSAGAFGLTRSVVDQWGMNPVIDEVTLRLLRIAYRRALGFEEDVYSDDFANRLAHRLKAQNVGAPDVALENAIMFGRGPALPQLLDRAGWKGDLQAGFLPDDPAVQRWKKDTSDIIASNSDRIIQIGERLEPDTLSVTPVLVDGLPVQPSGEAAPRVKVATPYAAELRRQIFAINNYLLEIRPGWFGRGTHRDVPPCVCYVGHHKECGCNCYVWVLPEYRREFEDFTLRQMRLIGLIQEPNSAIPPQGIVYSPATTGGVR